MSNIFKNFRVATADLRPSGDPFHARAPGPVPRTVGHVWSRPLGSWALQPKTLEQDRLIGKVSLPLRGKVFQNFS